MATYKLMLVDDDLWKKFKIICTTNGETLRKRLEILVQDYVSKEEGKKNEK